MVNHPPEPVTSCEEGQEMRQQEQSSDERLMQRAYQRGYVAGLEAAAKIVEIQQYPYYHVIAAAIRAEKESDRD